MVMKSDRAGIGSRPNPESGRQRIIRAIHECLQRGYFPSHGEIAEMVPGVSAKNINQVRWQTGRELGLVGKKVRVSVDLARAS